MKPTPVSRQQSLKHHVHADKALRPKTCLRCETLVENRDQLLKERN